LIGKGGRRVERLKWVGGEDRFILKRMKRKLRRMMRRFVFFFYIENES
jgi:hypothetical protein